MILHITPDLVPGMIAVVVIAAIVIPIALSWYSWLVKR